MQATFLLTLSFNNVALHFMLRFNKLFNKLFEYLIHAQQIFPVAKSRSNVFFTSAKSNFLASATVSIHATSGCSLQCNIVA